MPQEEMSYGEWLRHRRKALDFTQKDLARQAGYSEIAIRKIEADECRPSREGAKSLAPCLGVPPEQTLPFVRFARGGPHAAPPPLAWARNGDGRLRPEDNRADSPLRIPLLSERAQERDLRHGLIEHIRQFLLELGKGFAYVGSEYKLEVEGREYRIDLLFYYLHLRRFVIELKPGEFEPEYAGKLSFYLSAVDDQLGHASNEPSIGIILCKSRNRLIVEYALRDLNKPISVSEYLLNVVPELPASLIASLPPLPNWKNSKLNSEKRVTVTVTPANRRAGQIAANSMSPQALYRLLLKRTGILPAGPSTRNSYFPKRGRVAVLGTRPQDSMHKHIST